MTDAKVVAAEFKEQTAVAVRSEMGVVDVEAAVAEWEAYQELTRRLLDDSDYQKIGKTRFKKKSAWRKYARAFNISCEKVSEEIQRDERGFPIYARIVVRATDPAGRYQDGEQECHVTERCCDQPCRKKSWRNHYCCPAGCDGRQHFSHPGDLSSTAFTRAKNRAIADLIGAGEVSAEEMKDKPADEVAEAAYEARQAERGEPTPPQGKPATPAQAEMKARYDLRQALTQNYGNDMDEGALAFVRERMPDAVTETVILFEGIPADKCQELIEALSPQEQGG